MPKLSSVTPLAVAVAALLVPASLTLPAAQSVEPETTAGVPFNCSAKIIDSTPGKTVFTGKEALAAMDGADVAKAAKANGVSRTEMFEMLVEDKTVKLNDCGRVFFTEPSKVRPAGAPMLEPVETFSRALDASGDAFALESRPGADRTVYLDFDGVVLNNSAWNSYFTIPNGYTLSAYDLDGNPGSFSTFEREAIKQIWLRVAEDFAPFNINVTTKAPAYSDIARSNSSDNKYGTTVAITNDQQTADACGCGGLAWLNVIGITPESTHTQYQPALVYAKNLGSGFPKYVALAASHEAGHNFGLMHDGTTSLPYYYGQGIWGPIMGAPYNAPITTWSNGDYADANNKEDDLKIISDNAGYAVDDHGNSRANATEITAGNTMLGTIERNGDQDWFTFTAGAGSTTVSVSPQNVGPNLDAKLDIYDQENNLVASVNPASAFTDNVLTGMGASYTFPTVGGNTYTFSVSAVGQGNPLTTGYSHYGSLGRYSVVLETRDVPLAVKTNATLPEGTVSIRYNQTMSASGGISPYTWSLSSGTLPTGLTLSTSGNLAGTPSSQGTANFQITVTDAIGQTASRSMTLAVKNRLTVTTSGLPKAKIRVGYSQTLRANGGTGPYTWSLSQGRLPAGLQLTSKGVVRGTPSKTGSWSFTVRAKDAKNRIAAKTFTITVRR